MDKKELYEGILSLIRSAILNLGEECNEDYFTALNEYLAVGIAAKAHLLGSPGGKGGVAQNAEWHDDHWVINEEVKEDNSPFKTRESRKGMKHKKTILKPKVSDHVSQRRINGMIEAMAKLGVSTGMLKHYLAKPLEEGKIEQQDMNALVSLHTDLSNGVDLANYFEPWGNYDD